jgi:hypothetical protein
MKVRDRASGRIKFWVMGRVWVKISALPGPGIGIGLE